MSTTNSGIVTGFGGGAKIDGCNVLVTSGNLSRTLSPPYIRPYESDPVNEQKNIQIVLGTGVRAFTGNISFDMTKDAAEGLITNEFLSKNHEFEVELHDGHHGYKLENCKFDSFSISVSSGSLVTGTINFQSTKEFVMGKSNSDYLFDEDLQLIQYWNTGAKGVESFTITFTQSLTPVYLNLENGTEEDRKNPQYLRPGLWDLSFDVTTFNEEDSLSVYEHLELAVGPKKIKVNQAMFENKSVNYGGQTENGTYSYTLKAKGISRSSDEFMTIS